MGFSEPYSNPGTLPYEQELSRTLTLADLLAYGLVFIVPIAPIAVFGIVFNSSHGMVPLVYLVGLIAMVFTALSYMTMSAVFPVRLLVTLPVDLTNRTCFPFWPLLFC